MLGTIRMAVDNGSKVTDETVRPAMYDGETVPSRFSPVLKKRISYGVIHSLKRSGLTDLAPSQKKAYEEAYHEGYMDAWSAGASKKNANDRLATPPRTIAEIGLQDGAIQGSADVIPWRRD